MLVAEEDHQILGVRAVDLVHLPVAERARQIDPSDLAADDRGQLIDADRLVRRRFIGDMPDAGPTSVAKQLPKLLKFRGKTPCLASAVSNPAETKALAATLRILKKQETQELVADKNTALVETIPALGRDGA